MQPDNKNGYYAANENLYCKNYLIVRGSDPRIGGAAGYPAAPVSRFDRSLLPIRDGVSESMAVGTLSFDDRLCSVLEQTAAAL